MTVCSACCACVLREIQRLSGELDSQAVRTGVLLDTVETMQAGGSSEREQRLVALTAQLAAAKGLAAAQEARMQDLLVGAGHKPVQNLGLVWALQG